MFDVLLTKLGRLRRLFARKGEDAVEERETAVNQRDQSFAAGKAEAFADAEEQVREAQRD